jgi:ferrous iron transport protein A
VNSPPVTPVSLTELHRGDVAQVAELDAGAAAGLDTDERGRMVSRLRDLGFVAGARCEILARMWLGGDPLVVRVGGSTFALRRAEAAAIRVTRLAPVV